ncbi:hypothetical protein ACFV0H_16200 [Streptomyces erythrochromogenes]|uniref:Uncharacterized protein n=1 Tax=Streptomyces erythrochromogenes TaxID=285574 RepID=A0ABZ1Q9K1_9ACTN|nr:hypothetical protein [Streptomyces erythrochromogenes]MCX5584509.1 hypothetical protein [Streptomyces erythrochromogenes]
MSTVRRRTLVRAAAVTACAGSLLALPAAAALAEGVPAASSAHASAPQRTLVKSLSLADGVSTAKIYRTAKGAYQADILAADGAKATTLTSRDGVTDIGASGDLHAALDPAGRLTSWVGDAPAQSGGHAVAGDGHKTGTRDGQIVPVSAEQRAAAGDTRALEAASAEGRRLSTLADGPGDGMLLLAAGGGIAAVGAAGLGFAMLRRGRTDG